MSTPREGPNPLRPYYIPPSVGLPADPITNTTSAHSYSSKHVPSTAKPSFGSSARDILSDLDYSDYLSDSSPSLVDVIKGLIDQALWKYTSVLLAQPFEVAKTVLQVHVAQNGSRSAAAAEDMRRRPHSYRDEMYNDLSEDSDPDSPSYFTSSAPLSPHRRSESHSRGRRHITDRAGYIPPSPGGTYSPHKLELRRGDSLLEVISQLWTKEGAWGVWKGTNATFIYSILLKTVESWTRSLLSVLFNVPDPGLLAGSGVGGLDIVDSPYPLASLGVAVAAAGVAGVLLAPLDIIRTKLILTPTTQSPPSLLKNLRSLNLFALPPSIASITLLHSILPTFITTSAPLFLRSRLGVDPVLTPNTYSAATFLSSALELFIRLPLETVLRRGHISVVSSASRSTTRLTPPETVVDVGPYRGIVGTMWAIAKEEGGAGQDMVLGTDGAPAVKIGKKGRRKGQGVEGLFRGWRVGMWGLVGVWGAAALGGAGGKGGEF